jgi:hypothetical protein
LNDFVLIALGYSQFVLYNFDIGHYKFSLLAGYSRIDHHDHGRI